MTTLVGYKIKNTYKDLLQVSNSNAGIDATIRYLEDGEGTASVLGLSTTGVTVNGTFKIATGTLVSGGAYTWTFPAATVTLASVTGTETLTNKTITAPVLSGSITGTYTLAGTPTITNPTVTTGTFASPVLTTPTLGIVASGNISACTSTSMVLVTPVLGTPTSGALTNCTSIPVANATGLLAVVNGGTGVAASDPVIQRVSIQTGAVATGTTAVPIDDTIPQITEGDQYMTLAITPKNIANILVIDVTTLSTNSNASPTTLVTCLFQDSTANALAVMAAVNVATNNLTPVHLRHTMTAGTTAATTFRVRIGAGSAGTTTFNGAGGARSFGGVVASSITITEYAS